MESPVNAHRTISNCLYHAHRTRVQEEDYLYPLVVGYEAEVCGASVITGEAAFEMWVKLDREQTASLIERAHEWYAR
jgi:hypothetical protein